MGGESKIDFLFMAIINLLLLTKNNLVTKCAIHQKEKREEFKRKLTFREKIRWLSLQPFSSKSLTLPSKKWDKHQREVTFQTAVAVQHPRQNHLLGCQGKGDGQMSHPTPPWFQCKAVPICIRHVTHQFWLKGNGLVWQWGTQSPPFVLAPLPLFYVRKNCKIHYNGNPRHLSTKICVSPATVGLCFLTPIPPAILPSQGQERLFYNYFMCVNTNTAICSLWTLQVCWEACRLQLCLRSTSYKFLKHLSQGCLRSHC